VIATGVYPADSAEARLSVLSSANPVAVQLFGINYTYSFCIKRYHFTINPIISF
jgi:hypothetical protein